MEKTTKTTEDKTFTATEVGVMIERFDEKLSTLAESMDIKFDGVYSRFDNLETKVDRLQDDMVEVKYDLKNKIGRDEFEKLEKRVVKLENLNTAC